MSPIAEPNTFPLVALEEAVGLAFRPSGRFVMSRDGRPYCYVASALQAVVLGLRLGYDAHDTGSGEVLVAVDEQGPVLCVGGFRLLAAEGHHLAPSERTREFLARLEQALAVATRAEVARLVALWEGEPEDPSLDIEST